MEAYLSYEYGDEKGWEKLVKFVDLYEMAYTHEIEDACEEIHGWRCNMDSLHEGTVRGLLSEVEGAIFELKMK